jgi:hypothetical protein
MIDQADDECIHGIVPRASCTLCTAKPNMPTITHSFPAKYQGNCYACQESVSVGETLHAVKMPMQSVNFLSKKPLVVQEHTIYVCDECSGEYQ